MSEGEIKIEDNIPIPGRTAGAPHKYPWRKLKVGQSFQARMGAGTVGGIQKAARAEGIHLVSRTVGKPEQDGGKPMRRVWRVEAPEEGGAEE